MGNRWTLQDAKNKFSAVVEAAQKGRPQHVTKRGADAVVVLSAADCERLMKLGEKPKKTFAENLKDFPRIPEELEDFFDKREPAKLEPRDIDFD
jgi:antitoxin Phd